MSIYGIILIGAALLVAFGLSILSDIKLAKMKKERADKAQIKREVESYMKFEEFHKMMNETTNLKLGN